VEANKLSTSKFNALGFVTSWMLGKNRNWTFIDVEIVSLSWSELASRLIFNLFTAVCVNRAIYSGRWKPGFHRNMQPRFSGQKLRLTFLQTTLYHDIYVHSSHITATKISVFLNISHIIQFRVNWTSYDGG